MQPMKRIIQLEEYVTSIEDEGAASFQHFGQQSAEGAKSSV